jgi:hypothetical protein
MWRSITSLMNTGNPDRQYTSMQSYLTRTYVATICMGVRREVDSDARTTSLARCLRMLVEAPHLMTRTLFVAEAARRQLEATGEEWPDNMHTQRFNIFADGDGQELGVPVLQSWIDELHAAFEPVKPYADKVLAHRQRPDGTVVNIDPSWDQINFALDTTGSVFKRLYALRKPGTALTQVTPVGSLEFLRMFEHPWLRPGWTAPDDTDAF